MNGAEARRILDEYFPRRKVTRTFHYEQGGFNIIGFSESDVKEYRHCPLDPAVRLIMIKGALKCPTCGYIYTKEEAPNEEGVSIKHGKQKPMIVSGKGKKRYHDKSGNLITDPDLIAEIERGANVISYREDLPK